MKLKANTNKVTESQVKSWIMDAVREVHQSKGRTLKQEVDLAEHTANMLEKKAAISINSEAKQKTLAEVAKLRKMVSDARLKMRLSKTSSTLNKAGKALIVDSRNATIGKYSEQPFPTRTVKQTVMRENNLGELVPKTHMGIPVTKKVQQKMYKDVTQKGNMFSVPKDITKRVIAQMNINENKRMLQKNTKMMEKKIGRSKITVFE